MVGRGVRGQMQSARAWMETWKDFKGTVSADIQAKAEQIQKDFEAKVKAWQTEHGEEMRKLAEQAREAAQGKDIRLNGGVHTVRAFLKAGLVDYLHLAISPVLLGAGENLLEGIDLAALGMANAETVAGEGALHLVYRNALSA